MATILIVDDERIVREILKESLSRAGYETLSAKSGKEGIGVFNSKRPDLVLLDLMMPGIDGLEVLKEIRKIDKLVPIIFLTGSGSTEAEIKGMELGADDYISKTAKESQIHARIKRALERQKVSNSLSSSKNESILDIGSAKIDFSNLSIVLEEGAVERLTGVEAVILRFLASNREKFFSTQEILASLHSEYRNTGDVSSLRSQISRLKSKLGPSGKLLLCARNIGYRLSRSQEHLETEI